MTTEVTQLQESKLQSRWNWDLRACEFRCRK